MHPFTYIDLLNELIKLNENNPFIVEVKSFNVFAARLRAKNINCRISYIDIEEYAESIPQIAHIEASSIKFVPNSQWIKLINRMSNYYLSSEISTAFKESWEK